MLIDTRNEEVEKGTGFNPNVQNQVINATATSGQKALFVFICIITLGLFCIYNVTKKNWFNRKQMDINEKSSGIQVQLEQRAATLIKLVENTKQSMKFEKDLLTDVTKLRSQQINAENVTKADQQISSAYSRVLATFEQYPKLSSTETIRKLMSTEEYQEQELAAARRLYNQVVNEFNSALFQFPGCIPATKLHLHSFALFVASSEHQKDVNVSLDLNDK